MKNAVSWDVTQRGSCKNRGIGGTDRSHHQDVVGSVLQFPVTVNAVPISPYIFTLMMEAIL
jgi:hypothetical protein